MTEDHKVIQTAEIGDLSQNGDPITIEGININGNILEISVKYSGGCNKHEFSLVGSENISKSLPPRRAIKLIHKNMNDQCKKMIMEKIYFQIESLAYKKEMDSKITLDLEGWKESISYTFTK